RHSEGAPGAAVRRAGADLQPGRLPGPAGSACPARANLYRQHHERILPDGPAGDCGRFRAQDTGLRDIGPARTGGPVLDTLEPAAPGPVFGAHLPALPPGAVAAVVVLPQLRRAYQARDSIAP